MAVQSVDWGDLIARMLGSALSGYANYAIARSAPRQSFDLGRQFDQAEEELKRDIAAQLGKRGMSGAPAVTGAAMRPLADLKAQRALLESQVDYANRMYDYQNRMGFINNLLPYLWGYYDENYQQRAGAIPGAIDWLWDYWKSRTKPMEE